MSIANKFLESLKATLNSSNRDGIPLPMARDPKTGEGSITASMVIVSFCVCVVLLAGKVTNLVGDVDYNNALWLFGVSLGGYLGRKFTSDSKGISVGDKVAVSEDSSK
jgi:hypothetical protein